ncbi:unnamed protein product [Nezara viridula]|uniref:Uncharacterized protein n=1 Tax=Nezara viridula TaxID=85310 RepID=A0A9P0HTW2_NEZVI|nr:unnamed protein product [Nezara viridula]
MTLQLEQQTSSVTLGFWYILSYKRLRSYSSHNVGGLLHVIITE